MSGPLTAKEENVLLLESLFRLFLRFIWNLRTLENTLVLYMMALVVVAMQVSQLKLSVSTSELYNYGDYAFFIIGAGIYVTTGHQSLPNDGMIIANAVTNLMSEFRCLSGTSRYNVGQFIGTSGVDIVSNNADPFLIRRGSANNPGLIHIRNSRPFAPDYEGIYTCQIPDESGTMAQVNVGLYLNGTKGKKNIL